ncbi:MAG TPA: SMC family ATPase [Acidimicrobiia bacterium]|nr:SMC family ATPase [Acidimicrobiia bacterium]
MRPVRIRAQGFGAFRDPIDLDLTGVDFFALVGPTGAGKSTVIDAICFALYGSIPRYADNRAVAPAISLGALEARVGLHFLVDDAEYVITRVVQRGAKGGASTRESRLERILPGGGTESLAASAKEVNGAVARLLGLPFEHFTKCVVLPQGEFAEFLHAKPAERQDLVARLLNLGLYDRVGQRARQLAEETRVRVAHEDRRLATLAHASPDAIAAAEARVAEIDALREAIATRRPDDDRLAREIHDHERAATTAREMVATLAEIAVPDDVRRAHDVLAAATTRARAAADAVTRTEAAAEAARAAADSQPEPALLETALAARGELAEVAESLRVAADELAAADAERRARADGLAAADAALAAADAAYELARQVHLPHELAAKLVVGEPCPVCEQTVSALPRLEAVEELDAARRALDEAKHASSSARNAHAAADKRLGADRTRVEQLQVRHEALSARAAEFADVDLEALLAEARAVKAALAAALEEERSAHAHERAARAEVDALERELHGARQRLGQQRDALVSAGLTPPAPSTDVLADWEALDGWAAEERPRQEAAAATATAAARRAQEDRRAGVAALHDRARAFAIAGRDLGGLAEATAAAAAGAQRDVDDLTRDHAEATLLAASVAAAREEQIVAEELGRRLTARGFERWLVEEALDTLVTDATRTLRQLSAGAYSLAVDPDSADLLVIDHLNADEARSVRTLSGGETFQASLALALALSEQLADLAADGAARLESIFLDEGFGSLDPDTLETVASTIETLGHDGRMVGIVTHVRELAERVPVRFEVRKVGTSSTVERVDA